MSPDYTPETINMKICASRDRCLSPDGPQLPATKEYFYFNSSGNPRRYCKKCERNTKKLREQSDGEKRKEYNRTYREQHRDEINLKGRVNYWMNVEKERARCRERKVSIEKKREYQKRYVENNREKIRARYLAWQRSNKDKTKSKHHRRRAHILDVGGSFTEKDIQLMHQQQRGKCYWCLKSLGDTYEVDHRIPIFRGGSNDVSNIVLSCRHCNRSKGAKMPWEWNGRLL